MGAGTLALRLLKGCERSLLRRHPIVFRDSLSPASVELISRHPSGTVVDVLDHSGRHFLARGTSNSQSAASVACWIWPSHNDIPSLDSMWLANRLSQAIKLRKTLFPGISCYRVVWAEADYLPGIVLDKYENTFVLQLRNPYGNLHGLREVLVSQLQEHYGASFVQLVERRDGENAVELLHSVEACSERMWIKENDYEMVVDLTKGHKTGYYLDQRENRLVLRDLVQCKQVLDCFCYSGGFTVNALKGGACEVTNIDMSHSALECLEQNLARNFDKEVASRAQQLRGNCFEILQDLWKQGKRYDVVVLDPPKMYSPNRSKSKSLAGYLQINSSAFDLIRPGGLLMTFSCSGGVTLEKLQQVIAQAAVDRNREVQIIRYLNQPADHPIRTSFPESQYLKGLLCVIN